jgi:hypothetical protein
MQNWNHGRRRATATPTDPLPGADPRLLDMLHHPETARDWPDYVRRFVDAPFQPDEDARHDEASLFMMGWLILGREEAGTSRDTHWLSWLDLWIFFTLATGVPMARARYGPDGEWELRQEFRDRRIQFRL